MEWVHCNLCYLGLQESSSSTDGKPLTFLLTSCGHVICESCLRRVTDENEAFTKSCPSCTSGCSYLPLSNQIKPDVLKFFTDPSRLLEESLGRATEVIEFQCNHYRMALSHYKTRCSKLEQTIENVKAQLSRAQDLERENKVLREETSQLRHRLHHGGGGGGGVGGTSSRSQSPLAHSVGNNGVVLITPAMFGAQFPQRSDRHTGGGTFQGPGRPESVPNGRSPHSAQNGMPRRTPPSTPGGLSHRSSPHMTPASTPAPPARLSQRTPPQNGMMGTFASGQIPPSSATPAQRVGQTHNTHAAPTRPATATTTGFQTPMMGTPGMQKPAPRGPPPGASPHSSSSPLRTPQWDPNAKRMVQMVYVGNQPGRLPAMSTPVMTPRPTTARR